MSKINKKNKVTDTGEVPPGGRADFYTTGIDFHKKLRSGNVSKAIIKRGQDQQAVLSFYHLKGLEYGRWVNFADRKDYLAAINLAFYDLNQILKFDNNIGFDVLNFAVGARGSQRALAHYEPGSNSINITRFHRKLNNNLFSLPATKLELLEKTGGISSIAHEYGHFLDFLFGGYIDQVPGAFALTSPPGFRKQSSIAFMPIAPVGGEIRQQTEKVMQSIIWKTLPAGTEPGQLTSYYEKLKKIAEGKRDYYLRRTEIFARAFEVYIYEKLRKKKILNKALTHHAEYYSQWPYVNKQGRPAMIVQMDKLIDLMRIEVLKTDN